jgi:FkbH-like protein
LAGQALVRGDSGQLQRLVSRTDGMWQTDWAESPRQTADIEEPLASTVGPEAVRSAYLLSWSEHCIECAVPDCYALCPLYVSRRDRKCARFKNGISPNPKYPGLFPFGAEIEFRRWGKLESSLGFGSVKPQRARGLDRVDRGLLRSIRPVSYLFRSMSPKLRMNGAYAVLRERLLKVITYGRKEEFDEFVIEVWNLQSQPVRLVIECWQQGPKFRTSILLNPGRTVQRIPAASMNVDLYGAFGVVRVYPDNDAEAHLVFSWLDFVRYQRPLERRTAAGISGATASTADKVKCVIWDLDQTAWDGILGEQDADTVALRPEVRRTMMVLDERGILQSIASKNDHDTAWRVLERLGVAHLFLNPQINWEPKSANIHRIVSALNIGVDSCAFIDDSPFERAEVAHELPGIRVFADSDAATLLARPEFDVPVTEESRQRRAFYRAESERKEQAVPYGDRYEAFLRTCEMKATLFRPTKPEHVERCLELLHRSNQLNLSTHRYTREELAQLLARRDALCICTSSSDRFGEYGIVGFASLVLSNDCAVLKDFVLSCRVAQKKLENAWFRWLASVAGTSGYSRIRAPYAKTSRNGVLLKAMLEAGFVETMKRDAGSILELDCDVIPPASDIVSIAAQDLEMPPAAAFSLNSDQPACNDVGEPRHAAS